MSEFVPYATDDPRYFTVTSGEDYDRHHYRINFKNGDTKEVESWEEAYSIWFQWMKMSAIKNIEVLDIPKPTKRKSPKGF